MVNRINDMLIITGPIFIDYEAFFQGLREGGFDEALIVVQVLATGERKTLAKGGTNIQYATTGHLVYKRLGTLFAAPFDYTQLKVGNWIPVEEDIRLLANFVSVQTYAGQTEVAAGEFGESGGVRFISSSESSIDAGAGQSSTGSATTEGRNTGDRADIYNTVILARDAHGSVGLDFQHTKEIYRAGDSLPGVQVIQHARGSAGSADPLNELSTVGWKSWHVGTVLNGDWARVHRSTASLLESTP